MRTSFRMLLLLPLVLGCDLEPRGIDGSGNHPADPTLGAAGTPFLRLVPAAYADGIAAPAGAGRPGPRAISNAVCAQPHPVPNHARASAFLWQWGQFLDHDIDLSGTAYPDEPMDVPVPVGDPWFDPLWTGAAEIPFLRSTYDPATGTTPGSPREQMNAITHWIDASQVYGSDPERARALRALDGSGRLRTSPGDLLPFNEAGLPNAGGPGADLFLAGDVRANEQVGLTAMHTLFVREHNRIADGLRRARPELDDEDLYQWARRLVAAEIQAITYREFLPILLGPDALAPYGGWDPEVDSRISNLFATAAFRLGHSLLNPTLLRLDARNRPIPEGPLPLREAFFAPRRILDAGGIEPLLRGLAGQRAEELDVYVVEDVRNFLFGAPGAGGFDLAALNLQRGRDHGLPAYNDVRAALGLARRRDFAEVGSAPEVQAHLASVYADVDDLDVWLGGLAEDPLPGAMVGELLFTVLREQFEALRDGDRFWYERALLPAERRFVERSRLSDVVRRNTTIGRELPRDVFRVP